MGLRVRGLRVRQMGQASLNDRQWHVARLPPKAATARRAIVGLMLFCFKLPLFHILNQFSITIFLKKHETDKNQKSQTLSACQKRKNNRKNEGGFLSLEQGGLLARQATFLKISRLWPKIISFPQLVVKI